MEALMQQYLDPNFVSWLTEFYPFVGAGVAFGFIFAILGWVFGLVWSLVRAYLN